MVKDNKDALSSSEQHIVGNDKSKTGIEHTTQLYENCRSQKETKKPQPRPRTMIQKEQLTTDCEQDCEPEHTVLTNSSQVSIDSGVTLIEKDKREAKFPPPVPPKPPRAYSSAMQLTNIYDDLSFSSEWDSCSTSIKLSNIQRTSDIYSEPSPIKKKHSMDGSPIIPLPVPLGVMPIVNYTVTASSPLAKNHKLSNDQDAPYIETRNKFWPRAKYAMQQKKFMFVMSAIIATLSTFATLAFFNDHTKLAMITHNIGVPAAVLLAILLITYTLYSIVKKFKNTEENLIHIKHIDSNDILKKIKNQLLEKNSCLNEKFKNTPIGCIILNYDNSTILKFAFDISNTNMYGIARNNGIEIKGTWKIESLMADRPLLILVTGHVMANLILCSLYGFALPFTKMQLCVDLFMLATGICLCTYYYNRSSCASFTKYVTPCSDTGTINGELIDHIKKELARDESKEAANANLTQIIVRSFNGSSMIFQPIRLN